MKIKYSAPQQDTPGDELEGDAVQEEEPEEEDVFKTLVRVNVDENIKN